MSITTDLDEGHAFMYVAWTRLAPLACWGAGASDCELHLFCFFCLCGSGGLFWFLPFWKGQLIAGRQRDSQARRHVLNMATRRAVTGLQINVRDKLSNGLRVSVSFLPTIAIRGAHLTRGGS